MPYIAIKAYPKDDETKKKLVEKVNAAFLEVWDAHKRRFLFRLKK